MVLAGRPLVRTPEGSSLAVKVSVDETNAGLSEAVQAIDVISRLHGDGPLPSVTVYAESAEDEALAAFLWMPELGRASCIEVYPDNGYTAADVVHEVGHLLDAFGLGQGAYASPTHPLLDAWRVAVNRTSAVQLLRVHQAQTHVQLQGRRIRLDQPLLEYLLRPHELFARSYAQFVAVTSGDAALRAEIGQYAAAPGKTTVYPEQWNDLDFEPVADAFDQLFLNVGWWR